MTDAGTGAAGGERLPTASEVLISSLHLLLTIGYESTGFRPGSTADLAETERSIEGIRALLPAVTPLVPDDVVREYRQALSDLQMAYAEAVRRGSSPAAAQPEQSERAPEPQPDTVDTPPRPKIWTPRGDV